MLQGRREDTAMQPKMAACAVAAGLILSLGILNLGVRAAHTLTTHTRPRRRWARLWRTLRG